MDELLQRIEGEVAMLRKDYTKRIFDQYSTGTKLFIQVKLKESLDTLQRVRLRIVRTGDNVPPV